MKKKMSLMSLMFAVCASVAFAGDLPVVPCIPGYATSQVGDQVTTCENGTVTNIAHVGTTPVRLTVQLTDGSKTLIDVQGSTLNGQPFPISMGADHTYIASARKEGGKVKIVSGVVHDGLSITITPTLTKDGKIEVNFVAEKAELTSMTKLKQGGLEVDLPQVRSIGMKQTIILDNGKDITIPFGDIIKPTEPKDPVRSQYLLKMTAINGKGYWNRMVQKHIQSLDWMSKSRPRLRSLLCRSNGRKKTVRR